MTKKKNYSPEFKARIVRELVEGDDSVGVVAARHHLNANMISGWRRQLFDNAELIYAQDQEIRERGRGRTSTGRRLTTRVASSAS